MENTLLPPCNKQCDYCFLNYSNSLSSIPIFKNIEESRIRTIIRETHHQVRSYKKGDMILQAGEQCNYLYILVKGSVNAEMIDISGKVLKIETLMAPNTIAIAFIFGNNASCPVTVTADDEVKVMLFPKEELLTLFQKEKEFLQNYLSLVSDRAHFLSYKLQMMSFKTIKAKLAHFILESSNGNNEFRLSKTQQQLADFFGVERPSIARVLGELVTENIISIDKKIIKILNLQKLQSFID